MTTTTPLSLLSPQRLCQKTAIVCFAISKASADPSNDVRCSHLTVIACPSVPRAGLLQVALSLHPPIRRIAAPPCTSLTPDALRLTYIRVYCARFTTRRKKSTPHHPKTGPRVCHRSVPSAYWALWHQETWVQGTLASSLCGLAPRFLMPWTNPADAPDRRQPLSKRGLPSKSQYGAQPTSSVRGLRGVEGGCWYPVWDWR